MKHKVLAIVVSLVLIMSMVLPGTLAVSADQEGAASVLTVNSAEQTETTEADVPTAGSTPTPIGTTDTSKEEAPEVKTVTEEKKCNCTPVDGVHANTCPLYEAPKTEEKTGDTQAPAEPEKKCTCGAADGTHTADCALYVKPQDTNSEETKSEETKSEKTTPTTPPVTETQPQDPAVTALFDQLMACTTLDELFTLADKTPEEQLLALTDEQNAQIEAKIAALEPEPLPPIVLEECYNESVVSEIIYPAVNFDKVAPFGAPVGG